MLREIVEINEELCDGCGLCVPACHEGAIKIVDGKARLVSDRLCDGLGACLGHCPRDAIKIERREAEAFDEEMVAAEQAKQHAPTAPSPAPVPAHQGCPGSRMMQFAESESSSECGGDPSASVKSELRHWPVQLGLLAPNAPVLQGASLLVAADCVPIACADFHRRLLRGRAVVIGCPKFDDVGHYVEKLTDIIRLNGLKEIVVARMQVPCCSGIVGAVAAARERSGVDVSVKEVIIGMQGDVISERDLSADPMMPSGCSTIGI